MLTTILITMIAGLVFLMPVVFAVGLKLGARNKKPTIIKEKPMVEPVRFDDRVERKTEKHTLGHAQLVQLATAVQNFNALKNSQ